jgi:ParB-like chromosome segregation protein Spo0J
MPGEYNGAWKNVPKHKDFKFGQPVSELAKDISKRGIKTPVLVYKPEGQPRGVLIEGHHRAVAAGMVGADIPIEYTQDPKWESQAKAAKNANTYKRRMN